MRLENYQMQEQAENNIEKHAKYTVSVRIRPNLSNQTPCILPHKQKYIRQIKPKSIITYGFDRVFEENHNNQYIYHQSLAQSVRLFLNNRINTTILAYGQTGSGKTYTLFGNKTRNQRGLVDFIVEDIINFALQHKKIIKCSFLQIYKEKVTDLLTSQQVRLLQNNKGQLILQNSKVVEIKQKNQLLNLLGEAHSNKIFGNSYINSESSRSHVIFTITLNDRKFNIVDLCGSQVLTYEFNEQQRQQTNSINLSLFTLNAIVNDLARVEKNKNTYIPFRNSVLTRILKSSLLDTLKSQIYLFCNVSPEPKHQTFTSNTLRFGQLAIQIDEANDISEQKINLSQQKRQKKMVSNIIDLNPNFNQSEGTYKIKWNTNKILIGGKKTLIYQILDDSSHNNILFLHAYGEGCDGRDWNLHVSYHLKNIKSNFYSVDFPGFGESEGKKFTSRAQKFNEKDQAIQFMLKLFEKLGFNTNNKVVLQGYDLGGAIALSCCLNPKLAKCISSIIVFHPTWTDSVQKLAAVTIPTLILWMPVQTFHLVSAGQKMAKIIKNSKLYRLNIGPYTNQKAGGYYDSYSEFMSTIVADFLILQQKTKENSGQKEIKRNDRGKITEQIIQVNINEEEQKLIRSRQAVKQFYRLIAEGCAESVYEVIIKGGENKPKFIRLTAELPKIDLECISWQYLRQYQLINQIPKNIIRVDKLPFLIPGQQIQIIAKINLCVLEGNQKYLAIDKNGQMGITHKAYVSADQTQEDILQTQQIKINSKDINGNMVNVTAKLNDVLDLNSPTTYQRNTLGNLVFQDSVTCNYNSNIVKLKIIECCYHLKEIIKELDFSNNNEQLLSKQKKCSKIIYEQINLKHLVHEGIDNTRYTGTDVGRLAYYGQGNCHHLASVTAALLIPFGKLLGWDIMFRAGSFFKTGREIDENGNPLKGWNGKPKVNVEDHTWLEIRYYPSYKTFIFDPSFNLCSVELDQIYSFEGKMHISGKRLNFAGENKIPSVILKS